MPHVYMLRCADDSYDVGSTRNLDHRMIQHGLGKGSAYTRERMPVELIWAAEYDRVDEAYAIERMLHGWSRRKQEALMRGDWPDIRAAASRARPVQLDEPASPERAPSPDPPLPGPPPAAP